MSFPRYPKYKASGVKWLGDVPEEWEIKRSDSFLTYSRAQLDPKEFQGLEVFHYSIPVVQEIGTGQLEDGSEIASGKQVVKKKVVLVSKLNPRKGTICIAEPQNALTLCSTEFVALEPNGCDIRYLSYLVRTEGFRQGLESKVTSVTNSHQRANPVDIYRFWNAWPDLTEQTAIAEFLDRETGKIDELVAEQRRLIELLKEKRLAVISHAVTKGLNPHAPMKPSGIEWLGDVPDGWVISKLGYACKLKGGFAFAAGDFGTDGVAVVKMNNLKRGRLDLSEATRIPESSCNESVALCEGDLVWGMSGSTGETGSLGNFARVKAADLPCQLNQRVGRFKPDFSKLDLDFIEQVIQTPYFYEQIMLLVTGTAQYNVSSEQVQSCIFALPSLSEQAAIVEFLKTETAKFDTLTAEAQRAIDLLQERRTALISAAVTGKIDVREVPL